MNCARCNAFLPPEARFCHVCGLVVAIDASKAAIIDSADSAQAYQPAQEVAPTSPWQVQQPTQPAPLQQPYTSPQRMPQNQAVPSQAYQPAMSASPATLPSTGAWPSSPPLPQRRRKRRLTRVLLILVVVLLVLVAGWFVGLRPYLHGLAQSQIDGVLSSAVDQIPPAQLSLIPPGPRSVPVTETTMNNLIVLNIAPSNPVQQMHITITPGGLRLDFQVYGFACTVTGVPEALNGQLVITNVAEGGVVALVMSPDELRATLNAHLHDAVTKLNRNVTGVTLKNHEIDIELR
jgi:hypothetical protein